jgi:hypothetical protein
MFTNNSPLASEMEANKSNRFILFFKCKNETPGNRKIVFKGHSEKYVPAHCFYAACIR